MFTRSQDKHVVVEELLKSLVGVVDAQLLKCVKLGKEIQHIVFYSNIHHTMTAICFVYSISHTTCTYQNCLIAFQISFKSVALLVRR